VRIRRTLPPAAAPLRLADLWRSLGGLFGGKGKLQKLEKELAEHFGVRHVFLVSSGKAALSLILQALRTLHDRTEVVVPAYTCFSVPSAIVREGLTVKACDIDPDSLDLDRTKLETIVGDDTLCVLPSHLFGLPSDMDAIRQVCERRGVPVVEDAAQAMGGLYKGEKIGTLGEVGFFSLGRGKNITAGGGGIILTDSDEIAGPLSELYRTLRAPGIVEMLREFAALLAMSLLIRPSLYWLPAGLPFLRLGETVFHRDFPITRLSGLGAGFLHHWKQRLEESNGMRARIGDAFIKELDLADTEVGSVPFLRLPVLAEDEKCRDAILAAARALGAGLGCMYPSAINEIDEIREQFVGESFPEASRIAKRLLTVPTHGLLNNRDQEKIRSLLRTHAQDRPLRTIFHRAAKAETKS
jgi:dTDP-4-amino-4,6-dideoxygalactose transaminase